MGIPGDVGAFSVPAEMLSESLCHAHEVRSRYTLLDWLWGQNLHDALVTRMLEKQSGR
jgi:DNA topoisomerase IA